mmetsp:Transcript_6823/g.13562  ORF Transcript_6823/g.13562 Transcript_6823/m.13562 type:complete len:172 (+) Transcript_6823:124-639(+)
MMMNKTPCMVLIFLLLGLFGGSSTSTTSSSSCTRAQEIDSDIIRQDIGIFEEEKSVVDKTGWAPLFGEPGVPKLVGDATSTGDDVTLKWRPDIVRHPPVTYNVFCAIGVQTSCTSVDAADITGRGQTGIGQAPLVVSGTVRGVAEAASLTCFIVATNERGETCSDPIPVRK